MKIMILSVGGSSAPVINAVKEGNPDFVYFFCSRGPKGSEKTVAGPGEPCGDTRQSKCPHCGKDHYIGDPKGKAIVKQAGLDDGAYEIVAVDDPDDLSLCYATLKDLMDKIERDHGAHCEIIANYTGGTKTMTAAMTIAGLLTERCDLAVNVGPRVDLIKVRSGDTPVAVEKWRIFGEIQLELVKKAVKNYDYAQARVILAEILKRPVEREFKKMILKARQLCDAFDCWDKFQHEKAYEILSAARAPLPALQIAVKKILGKDNQANGYELVGDLINNAARKAARRYYDDAVARLYRALELFAQIRLEREYALQSGDISLERLETLRKGLGNEYRSRTRNDKKVQLGLNDVYTLLGTLGDPVGQAYVRERQSILYALAKRNYSIFAHGSTPLTAEDYREVSAIMVCFINATASLIKKDLTMPQLPRNVLI